MGCHVSSVHAIGIDPRVFASFCGCAISPGRVVVPALAKSAGVVFLSCSNPAKETAAGAFFGSVWSSRGFAVFALRQSFILKVLMLALGVGYGPIATRNIHPSTFAGNPCDGACYRDWPDVLKFYPQRFRAVSKEGFRWSSRFPISIFLPQRAKALRPLRLVARRHQPSPARRELSRTSQRSPSEF